MAERRIIAACWVAILYTIDHSDPVTGKDPKAEPYFINSLMSWFLGQSLKDAKPATTPSILRHVRSTKDKIWEAGHSRDVRKLIIS